MSAPSPASTSQQTFHVVDEVDTRQLALSAEEAYILSRIGDGVSFSTLVAATGMGKEQLGGALTRLEELGVVRRLDPDESCTEIGAAVASAHPDIDPELSINVDVQKRIIDLYDRLERLTHFELLGLATSADKAAVRRAYFAQIPTFHPDTYFKKKLGVFTKRMEQIFQRMTEAYETLSNERRRKEYESYLIAVGRTRPLEPSDPAEGLDDLERLLLAAAAQGQSDRERSPAEAPPSLPEVEPGEPPPLPNPPPLPDSPVEASAAVPPKLPRPPPRRPPANPAARRELLARKLGKTKPQPKITPSQPPRRHSSQLRMESVRHRAAIRDFRDRYEHRRTEIQDKRVETYVHAAEEAIAAGKPVSALNAVRIAAEAPRISNTLRVRLSNLEAEASRQLADSYLERARYEEGQGQYAEAARSYARSARGRPSSDVLRNAAECYLKAGTDLRHACELARQAVGIAPDRADLRLTLARVYDAAGMQTSAIKELERALEIAPENDRIKQWLKRIKRGGV